MSTQQFHKSKSDYYEDVSSRRKEQLKMLNNVEASKVINYPNKVQYIPAREKDSL